VLGDGLGSRIALADETGEVRTEYSYEPFGNTTTSGTPSSNQVQFTARERDATGLYYYRARYYDPSLQRFISEDPLGFGGGDSNLYAYVRNDPISSSDPFGLYHAAEVPSSMAGVGRCAVVGVG
jgi:RHS repeat-associated protein